LADVRASEISGLLCLKTSRAAPARQHAIAIANAFAPIERPHLAINDGSSILDPSHPDFEAETVLLRHQFI
jgi:hypothetical protein